MTHKRNSHCRQHHVDKGMEYINGGYEAQGEAIPTRDGLAIYLDVARETPINWAKQDSNLFKEEFAYINDRVQAIQGMKIVSGGLTGAFNPAFAAKVAANHGYGDRQTIDHTSSDNSMSPALDTSKLSTAALKELMAARASSKAE